MNKKTFKKLILTSALTTLIAGISISTINQTNANANSKINDKNLSIANKCEYKKIYQELNINSLSSDPNKWTKFSLGDNSNWYGLDHDRDANFYANIDSQKFNFVDKTKKFIIGDNTNSQSKTLFSKIKIEILPFKILHNRFANGVVENGNFDDILNPYFSNHKNEWGLCETNVNQTFKVLTDQEKSNISKFNPYYKFEHSFKEYETNGIEFNLNQKFTLDQYSNLNSKLIFENNERGTEKGLWGNDNWWSLMRLLLVQDDLDVNNLSFKISSSMRTDGFYKSFFDWCDPYVTEYISQPKNIQYKISLPYTIDDIKNFKQHFKRTICQPIKLTNSNSNIIFEKGADGSDIENSNEFKIKEIIKERAKEFYKNTNIVNKLGVLSNEEGIQNKLVSHIKLFVPDSQRNIVNRQKAKVRFYLGNDLNEKSISGQTNDPNKVFDWNLSNNLSSFYEAEIPIIVETNQNFESDINHLISINNYQNTNNEYLSDLFFEDNFENKLNWIKLNNYYKDNDYEFVGYYQIQDFFKFRLKNVKKPIYIKDTLEIEKYESKYIPFIKWRVKNNDQIFYEYEIPLDINKEFFEIDLGQYLSQNLFRLEKDQLIFDLVIKENSDEGLKSKWCCSFLYHPLINKAKFKRIDFNNQTNELQESNDKNFGMDLPKIGLVNFKAPEEFKNINNKSAFICEINSPHYEKFYSFNDKGQIEISLNDNHFQDDSFLPYIIFYKEELMSPIKEVEKINLTSKKTLISKSNLNNSTFGLIVTKNKDLKSFNYQIIKTANNSAINFTDLFLKHQSIVSDFWKTQWSQKLIDFLINKIKLFDDEKDIKNLNYEEVMRYWNLFSNYNENKNESITKSDISAYNISKIKLESISFSIDDYQKLKTELINEIISQLNKKMLERKWIASNVQLEYLKHFKIEENEEIFDQKIQTLINNFNQPLSNIKYLDFSIIINKDVFEKTSKIVPSGKTTIKILNNKNINNALDLNKIDNDPIMINSNNLTINQISKLIYKKIHLELINLVNEENKKYINLNDFDFSFTNERDNETKDIKNAINLFLVKNENEKEFKNQMKVKIVPKDNNNHLIKKSSCSKIIINNSDFEEKIDNEILEETDKTENPPTADSGENELNNNNQKRNLKYLWAIIPVAFATISSLGIWYYIKRRKK